jgi:two-component system OmpR family sensor kinase
MRLPRTLRGRLALFYAALIVVVLAAFAGTVWLIIETQEASEPPEVSALEGPDYTPQRMLIALLTALPVGAAVAVAGAVIISRRGLRPIDDVVEVTARIRAEDLRERIPQRPDAVTEVARLVGAVNGMLDRLARSVDGMRRFTADASHELRSPLAALMGERSWRCATPARPSSCAPPSRTRWRSWAACSGWSSRCSPWPAPMPTACPPPPRSSTWWS